MPPTIEIGTTSTNATPASFSEFASAGPSRPQTDDPLYCSDSPMFPRRKLPIQSRYCT